MCIYDVFELSEGDGLLRRRLEETQKKHVSQTLHPVSRRARLDDRPYTSPSLVNIVPRAQRHRHHIAYAHYTCFTTRHPITLVFLSFFL